jgi:hypothetical protein
MLLQHRLGMIRLLGSSDEPVDGDGIGTEGMPQDVRRPLYSQSLQTPDLQIENGYAAK